MVWWLAVVMAQDYRVPLSDADLPFVYPTAYKDHGGADWACGDLFYAGHQGSDFGVGSWEGMDAGRTVIAAAAGVVIEAHDGEDDRCTTGDCTSEVYGNHVRLRHADGKETVYGHMKRGSLLVAEGDAVACGAPLGLVGSSGWSTGPHLHFGVWDPAAGAFVDPFWGDCDGAPSYWTDQGDYRGLPGTSCDERPRCEPVATVRCGETWRGATAGRSSVAWWGPCSTFTGYTGAELAITIEAPPGEVRVDVTGLAADLDLFRVGSAQCDATACLGASTAGDEAPESLTWRSDGAPQLVALDGYEGAESAFTVTVTCTPDDDAGPPSDTQGEPPAAPPTADGDQTTDIQGGNRACGCDAAPQPGWIAGAALLLLRRRRRSAG